MSKSEWGLFLAADRSATDPKSRQLALKSCRRFLGRHGLGSGLEQLHHQAVSPLALALEVCPLGCLPCFEPRDLRLQCPDLSRQQSDGAGLASTWWAGFVLYLSAINAHQGFAVRTE
jgi:hypothetical protein